MNEMRPPVVLSVDHIAAFPELGEDKNPVITFYGSDGKDRQWRVQLRGDIKFEVLDSETEYAITHGEPEYINWPTPEGSDRVERQGQKHADP